MLAPMTAMTTADRVLYHQIHPAKLATDLVATAVAVWFWHEHRVLPALAFTVVPPIVASYVVLRTADLEKLRASAFGKYVKRNMTNAAQMRRLLGFVVLCVGAWTNSFIVAVLGAAFIVHAWTEGLLLRR
jgi:hypothetical protein